MSGAADRNIQADAEHQVLEHLAVLALLDGLGFGADHLHAVLFEGAALCKGHGGVQRRLAAERGQQNQFALSRRSAASLPSRGR